MHDVPPRRRRPRPEVARGEILDAARALLLSRPSHEVSVRAIMDATTLARPSFYDHFENRSAVITELVRPLMEANRAVIEAWPSRPTDPRAAVQVVTEALIATWREHGPLLLALADASRVDPDAADAYARFSADSVARVADKIARELEEGTVSGIDAEETATALVLMNRAYVSTRLLSPEPPPDATLVRTIVEVWSRVLWPGS